MYSKHLVFLRLPVLSILPGWLQAPGCYDGIPTDAISAKLSSTLWVREHSLILVFLLTIHQKDSEEPVSLCVFQLV